MTSWRWNPQGGVVAGPRAQGCACPRATLAACPGTRSTARWSLPAACARSSGLQADRGASRCGAEVLSDPQPPRRSQPGHSRPFQHTGLDLGPPGRPSCSPPSRPSSLLRPRSAPKRAASVPFTPLGVHDVPLRPRPGRLTRGGPSRKRGAGAGRVRDRGVRPASAQGKAGGFHRHIAEPKAPGGRPASRPGRPDPTPEPRRAQAPLGSRATGQVMTSALRLLEGHRVTAGAFPV